MGVINMFWKGGARDGVINMFLDGWGTEWAMYMDGWGMEWGK